MTLSSQLVGDLVASGFSNSSVFEMLDKLGLHDGPGNRYYVDSGSGNDTNAGTSWQYPMATLDAAIGLCSADSGDVILIAPGHAEDIGNAQIDLDVAGVSVFGLGHGSARPRFDFDHANASINIGASGCVLQNVVLRPSVTVVAIGVDVEAAVTDTLLKDLEFVPGEAGDGTDEFVLGVDIKAGCTRTRIEGLVYHHHASCDGAQAAVKFTGASDSCSVKDFEISITGTAAVAGIQGDTTLSTRLRIENGVITSDAEPGIELLTGTTGIIKDVSIFTDLATIDAATVADAMAHFDVKYVEVGNEAGTLVKTESADD